MFFLKARHLMVLLNRLRDGATVYAPLMNNLRLFTLNLSQREAGIHQIVDPKTYNQTLTPLQQQAEQVVQQRNSTRIPDLAERLRKELPDYSRLRDAFRQAGVSKPENLEEIQAHLEKATRSDPARGEDIYYLGFDNNAIRNRLYSAVIVPLSRRSESYNLRLARQVQRELKYRVSKIQGEFLDALNDLLPSFGAQNVFSNQNVLVDRLRLLAQGEWDAMLGTRRCELISLRRRRAGTPDDSDGIIIETYAQFANQPGRKVILFSSDNDFVVRCDGMPNLIGLFVSYPDRLGSNHCTQWENVSRLLYQLSVIYGRVDINTPVGETVRMYGVWRGKGVSHWREEAVKITVDAPSSVLLESVQRDATILAEAEGAEAS